VRDDFFAVLGKMLLGDVEKQAEAVTEYRSYHKKRDLWAQPIIWAQAKTLVPSEWWSIWGTNAPLLAPIVIQLLNAAHSAGGVERNLSTQGFVNSDRRRLPFGKSEAVRHATGARHGAQAGGSAPERQAPRQASAQA
jgi:hypothetical protein